ncbi:MAG: DUF2867 domain-containing protein [Ferrovibrio sp.]|uniref:DUF2867 domain-containing protein n=1 Tax=Ferrovibrio sp. TaxID=1917215 RepID=UPI00260A4652|nr:DUF2867 domain-containing protein [Ferrovibrio sp.]MCW0236072.1 DUF2867 domain-containing protein [Ferrovibrio sp.]
MRSPIVTNAATDPAFIASLPGCDFADAFSVTVPRRDLDAREVSAMFFSTPPAWAGALMDMRNAIMGRLGYKAPKIRKGFPVLRESATEVVSGLDDGHLDFRALTRIEAVDDGSRITLTTAVATHNWIGRAYLTAIMPFHKLIVRSMVRQLATRLTKNGLG